MKVKSKITKETYTNRYGDEFVFTLLEDGNIQWEGSFKWCRFGGDKKITMVDPSGGPFLKEGMELMGKTIERFMPNKDGYLILTQ